MGNRVQIAAPFTKVTPTEDGGRDVEGFATLERKDKQGEIADYAGTVKAFEKWSAEIEKASQGKSKGNLREMHQARPVGTVVNWQPGETTEAVDGADQTFKGVLVRSRVPPWKSETINDIDAGILTSYSIGGSYGERHWDETAKAFRYTPILAELSLVDNPAVPGATFAIVKSADGGGLELAKGMLAKAEDDTEREKLHAAAEARAKKYGIGVKEGGSLTPPKGKPTDEAEYGDPVNYAYPFDAPRKRAAVSRFNDESNREAGGYSEEEWAKIGKRIAEGVGDGHAFKDGKIESEKAEEAEKAALAVALAKAAKGEDLSHDDVRQLLSAALREKNGPFDNDGWWITDVWDDHFVACDWDDDRYWDVPYSIKDGAATLGEPVEVRQTWEPVKEAEKAMTDEEMAKIAALVAAALGKAGKKDETEEERKAREAKEAKAKEGAEDEDDKKDAEKAAGALTLLKSVADRLEKAAKRIPRRKHLMHAIDHIHRALGNEDEIQDKEHLDGPAEPTMYEGAAEKMVASIVEKLTASGALSKAAPVDFPALLKVAITEGTNGLAKAEDVSALTKGLAEATAALEVVKGQVKEIAEQPTAGPYVGAAPGLQGATDWGGMETAALKAVQAKSTDPLVKHAIGQELAVAEAAAMFRTGPRPTDPSRQ